MTVRSYATPESATSASSHSEARANVSVKVGGSGKPISWTAYQCAPPGGRWSGPRGVTPRSRRLGSSRSSSGKRSRSSAPRPWKRTSRPSGSPAGGRVRDCNESAATSRGTLSARTLRSLTAAGRLAATRPPTAIAATTDNGNATRRHTRSLQDARVSACLHAEHRQRQASFEEGAADDRCLAARLGDRNEVVLRVDSSRREHRGAGAFDDALQERHVGAAERPVAVDRGAQDARHADSAAALGRLVHGDRRRLRPAADGDMTVAHVDRDDEVFAERIGEPLERRVVGEGG